MANPDKRIPTFQCPERDTEACSALLDELYKDSYRLESQEIALGAERAASLLATAESIKARHANWGNTALIDTVSQVFYDLADKSASPANRYHRVCDGHRTIFRQRCTAAVVQKPVRR